MIPTFIKQTYADCPNAKDNDSARWHFPHLKCIPCDAQRLSRLTLAQVDDQWAEGRISTAARDGYRYVWAASATRSAAYDHYKSFDCEESKQYALAIAQAFEARTTDPHCP
ncbi:hypothetical protein [Amycolatopsis sp. NPDC004079]|uniref:hypothetical protein n=1 Tax=Amycolatopsis sp. NPDC004079 TaxID=3154549 RepID=UPI0033BE28D0